MFETIWMIEVRDPNKNDHGWWEIDPSLDAWDDEFQANSRAYTLNTIAHSQGRDCRYRATIVRLHKKSLDTPRPCDVESQP